eukprot:363897-Chlamydomonas_euryale.AAC.12
MLLVHLNQPAWALVACVHLQLLDEPLPPPPVEAGLLPHWLFINGIQPAIPENALIERPISRRARASLSQPVRKDAGAAGREGGAAAGGSAAQLAAEAAPAASAVTAAALASGQVAVQQPVQHVLSKELQLRYRSGRYGSGWDLRGCSVVGNERGWEGRHAASPVRQKACKRALGCVYGRRPLSGSMFMGMRTRCHMMVPHDGAS